ncbi:MAG TPA: tryptophan-rich sensory protein [Candidatus Gastranaerophilales bacterium]|nr:tryptophan-rich sensory protein [Candidatus Gastranaerophilales bacterium]
MNFTEIIEKIKIKNALSKRKNLLILIGSILLCVTAGIIAFITSKLAINDFSLMWYQFLFKPALMPPDWLFIAGWGMMYLFMGIALFFAVIEKTEKSKMPALIIFGAALVLSLFILPIFFRFESLFGAFVISLLCWLSIFICGYKFYRITMPAAMLLVIPNFWSVYIMGLSLTFWLLNNTSLIIKF